MWNTILRINWRKTAKEETDDDPIEGINGATITEMQGINTTIGRFLSVIEVPLYGAGVLGIVIIGELNFWSAPVSHETEPVSSIGKYSDTRHTNTHSRRAKLPTDHMS